MGPGRSHRKLAYRGSYTDRVWVFPRRFPPSLLTAYIRTPRLAPALGAQALPRLGRLPAELRLVYDTTHFTEAKVAGTVVEDLVCRKWVLTSSPPKRPARRSPIAFTDALAAEGSVQAEARGDGLVDPSVDDQAGFILLGVSGQCPQMTSGSDPGLHGAVRYWPATSDHRPRPATSLDRAVLRSREDKGRAPALHLRPGCAPSRAGRRPLALQQGGAALRHGLRQPGLEHDGKGQTIRKARRPGSMRPDSDALLSHRSNRPTAPPQGPGVLANQLEIGNANSGTRQPLALVVALWPAVRTHPALHFVD